MREEMMYDPVGVYIEPVASSSDFSRFIDSENFGFDSNEFWDKMDMWDGGEISGRYTAEWCQKVIDEDLEEPEYSKYYIVILELMKRYELKTIRFACDW